MAELVLDTSAILALFWDEPGGTAVATQLTRAVVSSVNVAEVATKLTERGLPPKEIRASVLASGFSIAAMDGEAAFAVGELRALTKTAGLSLGDRACLALAAALGVPAVTADRKWVDIADAVGVEVRLIR